MLVGRAPLWGVSCAGQPGVERALDILRDEMMRVLGLIGSLTPHSLDPGLLRLAADFGETAFHSQKETSE